MDEEDVPSDAKRMFFLGGGQNLARVMSVPYFAKIRQWSMPKAQFIKT